MTLRGSSLFAKIFKCLRESGYVVNELNLRHWYLSVRGRMYLIHRPSNARFDRVKFDKDTNDVDVNWIADEVRRISRSERENDVPEDEESERTFYFGGNSSNSVSVGKRVPPEMLEAAKVSLESGAIEVRPRPPPPLPRFPTEEDEEELEYEEVVAESEDDDNDEDFVVPGFFPVETRDAKRRIAVLEEENDRMKRWRRENDATSTVCRRENCEALGDGARCRSGHAFCAKHTEEIVKNRSHEDCRCGNPGCFDFFMLETMRHYVPGYVFDRLKAREGERSSDPADVTFEKDSRMVRVPVKQMECQICSSIPSDAVILHCESRSARETACEPVVCRSCATQIKKRSADWNRTCFNCKKKWSGEMSSNMFLNKLCAALPKEYF